MYSVVLVLAVTAGGETPDFGHRSCYGCCGYYGCYGGYSCYGCRGYHGCCGYYGGCCGYYRGCCGGYGYGGCCGGTMVPAPMGTMQGKQAMTSQVANPTMARIIVNVQPDARVTVDGQATRSTSAVRVFETPALQAGKSYAYELKAEFQQNGKTMIASKRVTVEPGGMVRVDLRQADVAVVRK